MRLLETGAEVCFYHPRGDKDMQVSAFFRKKNPLKLLFLLG
jgi:hypothetical protein